MNIDRQWLTLLSSLIRFSMSYSQILFHIPTIVVIHILHTFKITLKFLHSAFSIQYLYSLNLTQIEKTPKGITHHKGRLLLRVPNIWRAQVFIWKIFLTRGTNVTINWFFVMCKCMHVQNSGVRVIHSLVSTWIKLICRIQWKKQ